MKGAPSQEEVLKYLSDVGFKVLRILPAGEAKHVFTHKEWHMNGYLIRVDELDRGSAQGDARNWIFVEPGETMEKYPIPSAYEAYAKRISLIRGKNRFLEE